MPFVPTKQLIVGLLLFVPLAALAAGVPLLSWALVGLALSLLVGFVLDGLRRPPEGLVIVEREVPRTLSVGEPGEILLRLRNRAAHPLQVTLADGCPPLLGAEEEVIELVLGAQQTVERRYAVLPLKRGAASFAPLALRLRRPRRCQLPARR